MNQRFSYFDSDQCMQQNDQKSLQSYHQSMPSLFANQSIQRKAFQRQTVQDLKNKMNRYNNQLLLPRCLQKTFTRKFTLSPLGQAERLTQNKFKLKNYETKHVIDYDCPVQDEEQQQDTNKVYQHSNNNSLLNTTNFSKFQSNSSKFGNKQNLTYQNQLKETLITQSKLKYQPRNRLKNIKLSTKRSFDFVSGENSNINETNLCQQTHDLNKTRSQISFRTFLTKKSIQNNQNKELLNSTRTKLLSHLNEAPKQSFTKADIFPLERLLEKRSRKLNFRNKWFNQKTINLEQKL